MLFAALPKVPVHLSRMPSARVRSFHYWASEELAKMFVEDGKTNSPPSIEQLRVKMKQYQFEQLSQGRDINPYSGQPYREEDSPGNYIFRQTPSGVQYVWYTGNGEEKVAPLFKANPAR